MPALIPTDISIVFLSAGILLVAARLLGGMAKRWGQPPVFGELITGIILGPTILGALVIMAIVTSMMSGPMMQRILKLKDSAEPAA